MKKTSNVSELQTIAKQMRREIVEMITFAKSGHPGGSLSAVEILVTLFFDVMRHDPANPKWPDRDHFVLSKGHAGPELYTVMAECGYTPKNQLNTLRKLGSIYQEHPDVRFIPALEASTGSLGEGLSIGIGLSLAAKLDQRPSRTFVVLGDGEIQEGQIWESAMFAGNKGVDNLVASHSRLQSHSTGRICERHHAARSGARQVASVQLAHHRGGWTQHSRAAGGVRRGGGNQGSADHDRRAHHRGEGFVHGE
jgi:transketolase N-terminal domain/subunit